MYYKSELQYLLLNIKKKSLVGLGGEMVYLLGKKAIAHNLQNTNKVRSTILTAFLWNIWKRRNALVFRLEEEPCVSTLRRCSADLQLWRHRVQDLRAKLCLYNWSSFLCN